MHMGVDRNRGPFETIDQHAVCGFSANRRKGQQLFHLIRDFAFVLLQDYLSDPLNGPSLGFVEAYGLDDPSDGSRICVGELGWAGILWKRRDDASAVTGSFVRCDSMVAM